MTATVELHATGDLMLFGRYDQIASEGQGAGVFARLRPVFREADLVLGNLECVLSELGTPQAGKLCLRGAAAFIEVLAETGFSVMSLANNHSFDFDDAAFIDMRNRLEAARIATFGAGADLAAAREARIVEANGLRLGFLGYCHASTRNLAFAEGLRPGVAPLDPNVVFEDIAILRPLVDHVVLSLHWGLEYAALPTPEQVQLAHAAIDRGASLIVGHHSHMLQGIERYKHGVIAYSLANLTDADVDLEQHGKRYEYRMQDVDRESVVLRVRFQRGQVELLEPLPLWLADDGAPEPAEGERQAKILADVAARTEALAKPDLTAEWEAQLVSKRVAGPLLYWWRNGSLLDKVRRFRFSQLKTLYLLARTFIRIRFSGSEERWGLFNPRNDTEPMPYGGDANPSESDPGSTGPEKPKRQ